MGSLPIIPFCRAGFSRSMNKRKKIGIGISDFRELREAEGKEHG
ncbi:hypothetical protein DBT_2395 [Dissulfuribacter thermophilus]|uniref:Uncharacterized protein n=1 Tax=Dissulfuribacter thermophilus TaxID=1156395 RepID=A0A1B9F2P0_9BACT|nr:hypothetical protein DBT_2395 [Dissulfuribacter thermophilus]